MATLQKTVTLSELEIALETKEYTEISNLCDKNGGIDTTKLQYALDRAYKLIDSYFKIGGNCAKAYIQCMECVLVIWIARYLLDTIKTRPQVQKDYEEAIKILTFARELKETECPLSIEELTDLGFPVELGVRFSTNNRRFTNRSMRQFRNPSLSDFQYRRNLLSRYNYKCNSNDDEVWSYFDNKY